MSKFKDWTGIDFTLWKKIGHKVSEFVSWLKLYRELKKGHGKFELAKKMADDYHKKDGSMYYVFTDLLGRYRTVRAKDIPLMKKMGFIPKWWTINEVLRNCNYKTK